MELSIDLRIQYIYAPYYVTESYNTSYLNSGALHGTVYLSKVYIMIIRPWYHIMHGNKFKFITIIVITLIIDFEYLCPRPADVLQLAISKRDFKN